MSHLVGSRILILRLIGACSFLLCAQAYGGVGNLCTPGFGPCDFTHPTVINLYWDATPTQWDTDVGGPASGLTVAQIDTFIRALVHSSYFSQLAQYGVTSVSFLPSITAGSCGAPPANVDAAINGGIDALIRCIATTNSTVAGFDQGIINVFLPPQVINTGFCDKLPDNSHNAAEHSQSADTGKRLWTVIPTTSACNSGSLTVLSAVTHEMVEAATDPNSAAPSGWKAIGDGEIGDFCESINTPYIFGTAQQYWSNLAGACVPGFATTSALSVSSTSVCGTGRHMQFVLNGTFGPTPWDLAANPILGQTLYVRASIGAKSWTAGNLLGAPPDTVGFAKISWVQGGGPGGSDQIKVLGFDSSYGTSGQLVSPGDVITITIENPDNGVRTTASVAAPSVNQISAFGAAPDTLVGQISHISGTALDSSGCGVENASLTLSATGGTVTPTLVTGSDGSFGTPFKAPDVAGPVIIRVSGPALASASVTSNVHPRLDSLVPPRGATAGGQTTVLSGLGFDSSTVVTFGPNRGTVKSVASDHKSVTISTPASTLGTLGGGTGRVPVGVTVNTIGAFGLQYDYIQPSVPVMEFLGGADAGGESHTCNVGRIKVSLFNADGSLQTESIALSASYPAFLIGFIPKGHSGRSTSATIASGSQVTIFGGGPITAVNPNNPTNSVSESFPVWPQDLCDLVTAANVKIGQIVAGKALVLHEFNPACSGDCGPAGIKTVFWGDAEDLSNARNLVWIQSADAAAITGAYQVEGVSEDAQQKLVADNPFVVTQSRLKGVASFAGPMIEIRKRDVIESVSPISDTCHISFAVTDPSGTYSIVHLRSVGGRKAWIEEKTTAISRHGTVVTTAAESSGIYALVHLSGSRRASR